MIYSPQSFKLLYRFNTNSLLLCKTITRWKEAMISKHIMFFPNNVFLKMEKYTTSSYSPIFFFYFILPNITSNFLIIELSTINLINSNWNPFTNGADCITSTYSLRVCAIHLSTFINQLHSFSSYDFISIFKFITV